MRDFFNNELAVGDRVAFIPNGYRDLAVATIVAFTPKQVRVSYVNTWNYGLPGRPDETLRHPKTLIKDLTGGWGNDGQGV